MKKCRRCKKTKDLSAFSVQRQGKRGPVYYAKCRPCASAYRLERRKLKFGDCLTYNRWQHLKHRYGLTLEEYNVMIANGCKICASKVNLHVDHCHSTGKIRGILCINCNLALGGFKHSNVNLQAAIEYLAA